MTNLQEVPTEELLSFQDYPAVHTTANQNVDSSQLQAEISVNIDKNDFGSYEKGGGGDAPLNTGDEDSSARSFWTIEYYQQFFDVNTKDVIDRILSSITPRRDGALSRHLQTKPDLYGPFWISVTLVFTIAISGNIANYFQHANEHYRWKYDFHLVSYAATVIWMYVLLIPFALWALLKWSSDVSDLDGLEDGKTPSALELVCLYGYSLFIYIPVSILWTIQISMLQWILALVASLLSGSVLLFNLMPSLRLSRHKFILIIGIISCHLFLAAGFMLYFFHGSKEQSIVTPVSTAHTNTTNVKSI